MKLKSKKKERFMYFMKNDRMFQEWFAKFPAGNIFLNRLKLIGIKSSEND